MASFKKFVITHPFVVIPAFFVVATILMDIIMYSFMGLAFPSRYYFSIIIMLSICGLLFLIRKPAIQFAICLFLLLVHFGAGTGNIVLYRQKGEIISVESLSAARQVTSLTDFIVVDFDYMALFILTQITFIAASIFVIRLIKRKSQENPIINLAVEKKPFTRNLFIAVATLALMSYATGMFYNFTLPYINTNANNAFDNYTNDRFVYTTFSNRTRILQNFGTYSYYWSNISFALLGLKPEYEYKIDDEINDTFAFEALPDGKQNVIMLQMESLERNLINPIVMPNLYNFLYGDYIMQSGDYTAQHVADMIGFYSVDRTCVSEYAALAGTHLDGVDMNSMPYTQSPYSLPYILERSSKYSLETPYESIKAFHNYYDYFYNRNVFFDYGLGFQNFVASKDKDSTSFVENIGYTADSIFNHNSDYKLFLNQSENIAPADKKFFSFIENISTHTPYYDANLFTFYEQSGEYILSQTEALKDLYFNMSSSDNRTVNAIKSLCTAAYEYDRGLGELFSHLKTNDLLDKTTIIFYSDHNNYANPNLLAETEDDFPGTQGRMLAFYVYSPAIKEPMQIKKFITHYDIYSTVCDLLHIATNSKYTLGISAFDSLYPADSNDPLEIPVFYSTRENIGFSISTALVFNDKFATYDFETYLPHSQVPTNEEASVAKLRASYIIAVMNNMRQKYRSNTLRDIEDIFYYITNTEP